MKLVFVFCDLDCGYCDMLDSMPVTMKTKNYSHCPLKKRPVPVFDGKLKFLVIRRKFCSVLENQLTVFGFV